MIRSFRQRLVIWMVALVAQTAMAQTLVFDSEVKRLPDLVEGDTLPHRLVFRCINDGNETIRIDYVHASCGCTKVRRYPNTIKPHHIDSIVVEYRTLRRGAGTIDEPLYVYAMNDVVLATLHVTGNITGSTDSRWNHLPQSMGPLRLRRKSLTFGSNDRILRIPCYNNGDAPLTIIPLLMASGVTFHTEPTTIEPGTEADIVVGIDRSKAPRHSTITLTGIPCDLRQRKIEIKIYNK